MSHAARLADRLAHWAELQPEQAAMTFEGRTWTWAELQDRVRRVTGALLAADVRRGDVVAFLDKNHPACLEVTLGASELGAANAVLNWRLSAEELVYVINDSGARILFVGAEFVAAVDAIRSQVDRVQSVVVVGGQMDGYESWLGSASPAPCQPDVESSDPALVLYTSGTTGFPKGAALTHGSLIAHTVAARTAFAVESGDHNLVALPLFHVGGSSYALLGIDAGVRTTIVREVTPAVLLPALLDGATHMFVVPALLAGVIAGGGQITASFGSLKILAYGASPMPTPLLRACLAAWPETGFLHVYGMTELSGVVSTLSPAAHRDEAHPERLTSAGLPLPGIEVRVVDPDTGRDLSPGAVGELWFRSAQVMGGYLGRPEATAQAIVDDGWLRSGDAGRLDADGYIHILDRIKDMVITGGENVYSPEVERVLVDHPAVAEAAVIGLPDPRWGEAVHAVLVARAGTTPDTAEIIEYCRGRLAHYKAPRSITVTGSLPRNTTGKVLKRELRATISQTTERQPREARP